LLNGKTLGGWDEQGLVASVVTNNNHVIVPLTSLAIVEPSSNIPLNASALHFVEANRLKKHRGWEQFKVKTISCL
jgi:hypothetical protein